MRRLILPVYHVARVAFYTVPLLPLLCTRITLFAFVFLLQLGQLLVGNRRNRNVRKLVFAKHVPRVEIHAQRNRAHKEKPGKVLPEKWLPNPIQGRSHLESFGVPVAVVSFSELLVVVWRKIPRETYGAPITAIMVERRRLVVVG